MPYGKTHKIKKNFGQYHGQSCVSGVDSGALVTAKY